MKDKLQLNKAKADIKTAAVHKMEAAKKLQLLMSGLLLKITNFMEWEYLIHQLIFQKKCKMKL